MYKWIFFVSIGIFSINAPANVTTDVLNDYYNKEGRYTQIYEGESVGVGTCEVMKNPDVQGIVDMQIQSDTYFKPPFIDLATAELEEQTEKKTVIRTNRDPKRPGGNIACGNIPVINFKERLIIQTDSVEIQRRFNCADRFWDRITISHRCTY